MLARTSTPSAPWVVVEAEDKRWARVRVLEATVEHIERGSLDRGLPVPPPSEGLKP